MMKKLFFLLFTGVLVLGCADDDDAVETIIIEADEFLCNAPTGVSASDIDGEGATISWSGDDNGLVYNVEYGPEGFTPGNGTTVSSIDESVEIEDLVFATSYDVYVTAKCGQGVTASSGAFTFATPDEAPVPAGDYLVTQITPSIFGYDTFDPDGGGVILTLYAGDDADDNTEEDIDLEDRQAAFDADYIAALGFGNTATYVISVEDDVVTFATEEDTLLFCADAIFLGPSANAEAYTSNTEFNLIFIDDVTDQCGQGSPEVTLNFQLQ